MSDSPDRKTLGLYTAPDTTSASALTRDLRFFLSSLKHSIERFPSRRDRSDPIFQEMWANAVLGVESIRINLSPSVHPYNQTELASAVSDALVKLEELSAQRAFSLVASRARFRLSLPSRSLEEYKEFFPENANALDALRIFATIIKKKSADIFGTKNSSASLATLRRVIPDQKTSPVQFSIKDNRIVVVRGTAQANPEDASNITSSKETLLANGKKLLDELQRSNCDRRLLDQVSELQQALSESKNVITLGLLNINCEMTGGMFENELPDAIRGMLLGQTRGISMYVAQFPDWQRFSESAAAVELDREDIRRISNAAEKIAESLEHYTDIAESEVPKTIRAIQKLVENPAIATKRSAFAVLRTLENLIAKAFQHGVDLLEKTATKTVDGLSSAASKILIAAFLTVTLGGAAEISPLASKVAEAAWLKKAVEIVKIQIENLEK